MAIVTLRQVSLVVSKVLPQRVLLVLPFSLHAIDLIWMHPTIFFPLQDFQIT